MSAYGCRTEAEDLRAFVATLEAIRRGESPWTRRPCRYEPLTPETAAQAEASLMAQVRQRRTA